MANAPQFSWTRSELSILGIEGEAAGLFNLGLITTGVLEIVFAIGFARTMKKLMVLSGNDSAKNVTFRLTRMGIASLIVGALALSLVGSFTRNIDLPYDIASLLFFLFHILAFVLIGTALVLLSRRGWGFLSLAAGVVTIILRAMPWPWSGGAIPQLLYSLPWSMWMLASGIVLLSGTGLQDGALK